MEINQYKNSILVVHTIIMYIIIYVYAFLFGYGLNSSDTRTKTQYYMYYGGQTFLSKWLPLKIWFHLIFCTKRITTHFIQIWQQEL